MSNDSGYSFYDVLGISHTASLIEIKQSYRKLALKYHPDRNLGDIEYATEIFKRIAEAYSILSDECLRRNYDSKFKSVVPSSSSNFPLKQESKNVPTAAYNHTPSYSAPNPEPNPIIFNCDFSIHKAQRIFNDFFADFEEFEGGEVRNPYLSVKNRNQMKESSQLISFNPSVVVRNTSYSHRMSPSEQHFYRNVDVRDKYKNSTFNSASPMPATQFLYVFGTDSDKNRKLKLIHRRRNMI